MTELKKDVYVAAISDVSTGNTSIKRLELRQEIARSNKNEGGKIGMLLAGAIGKDGKEISAGVEKRVCWENISVKNLEAWGLKVGDTLASKIGQPCKIVVKEAHTPFYAGQQEKINPSTGEVLKKGGLSIYRNSTLTFDMEAKDELIAHDVATVTLGRAVSSEFSATEKLNN